MGIAARSESLPVWRESAEEREKYLGDALTVRARVDVGLTLCEEEHAQRLVRIQTPGRGRTGQVAVWVGFRGD